MKHFCTYEVISLRSGLVLAVGGKYKTFDKRYLDFYIYSGSFRESRLFGRLVDSYFRFAIIKGIHCIILYYVYRRASKKDIERVSNIVTGAGQMLDFSGRTYTLLNYDCVELLEMLAANKFFM